MRRSTTPVISEMSSTSRYDNLSYSDTDSTLLRQNANPGHGTKNDPRSSGYYYKLENINRLSNRASDSVLSYGMHPTFGKDFNKGIQPRIAFDIDTVTKGSFTCNDDCIKKPCLDCCLSRSKSVTRQSNAGVMFHFQLSWESDSDNYCYEMESSSVDWKP